MLFDELYKLLTENKESPSLLRETYNPENSYLLTYLKRRPFESSEFHYELSNHWDGWGDALETLGSSLEDYDALLAADDMDAIFDLCYRLDEWLDAHPSEKEDAAEVLLQHNPVDAPTWAYLDLNVIRLLPATTWMVHWSDHADAIATNGFTRGVFDLTKLGLTTYTRDRVSGPGYNFAFVLDSPDAENRKFKYGTECVVFQSSGVECYHNGDEEDQCIFWGPGITTKPVLVNHDDDDDKWCVRGAKGSALVRFDTVDQCFDWIKAHGDRYRRKLGLQR